MRRSSIFTRLAPPRTAIMVLCATIVSVALLASGVAVADTVTTNFEPQLFHTGSVNGQDGWKSAPPGSIPNCNPTPTNGQYDQAVVLNTGAPAAFGAQSLQMSNLCGNGEFFFQTYSTPVAAAGENLANTEYTAQFSFISKTPNAEQPGLFLSVSPDSYEGSRMSYVSLRDTPQGIRATVTDTPEPNGEFVAYDAGLLDRKVAHTIKFWIKLNPGPDNDLVRIFIDGVDVGQCFTTWENYYRTSPEQAPPPNVNTPATLNSLQFRSSVQGPPELATSGGYLFDNVTTTTANGKGPPGCDIPIDKQADSRTVSAGGRAGYRISVRNRGSLSTRNLRVCDHIPRRMTFVSADHKLRRLGRARCLMIPRLAPGQRVSFHLVLRVDANAPPGTEANTADVTPGVELPFPLPTPGADVPRPPVAPEAIKKVKALVKVLAKRAAPRRGRQPRFTG